MRLIPLIAFLPCAGLILSCSGSSGGGGSSSSLAKAMCDRAVECDDMPTNQTAPCIEGTSLMLDPMAAIINADAAQCFSNASCDEINQLGQEIMVECAGVDPGSGECVGATTLKICNTAGICAEVDCKKVCTKASPRATAGCGPSDFDEDTPISTCSCSENASISPP